VPIQYVVNFPVAFLNWTEDTLTSRQQLIKDNTHLKAQLILLEARLQQQNAIEADNQQLKALLRSTSGVQGKVLEAQLLAVASEPSVRQVVLNKGTVDHVYIGQPVIDPYGVIGQVIEVGKLTSRAMLLTDAQSAIPVQVLRTGVRSIAVGEGVLDSMRLLHVPETTDIRVGDQLITSGLGQHFPYGYPVGKVVTVNKDPGSTFMDIKVLPSGHLNHSRLVLLVWPVVTMNTSATQTEKKYVSKK
ncbi:MAG: rod shape-determining protein MreC, partial [Gammaproteobacteria bacterium]|nr:rod shape-determining protein MreC [Gammaproteobacteria bacterium]